MARSGNLPCKHKNRIAGIVSGRSALLSDEAVDDILCSPEKWNNGYLRAPDDG